MWQPLEQFNTLFFSVITNSVFAIKTLAVSKYSLIIIVTFFVLVTYFLSTSNKKNLNLRIFSLQFYNKIVLEMVNVVSYNFMFFMVLFFTIFSYVYFFNLTGLLPNTPCWTTQIFANLTLSFTLIIGITLMNLDKNGILFFELFVPKDVPHFPIPLLFALELTSYFIRILSLSIRLFSNMVAGHSLLHILFDMVTNVKNILDFKLDYLFFTFSLLILVLVIIVLFEFIVAFLQAYVFAIMFTIYLNDLTIKH